MEITAGILAGGKSTRMGRDKALLKYQGESFLHHLVRECGGFPEVLVSLGKEDPKRDLPYRTVVDERPDQGPLEGIYQLLLAAEYPYVLVIATDMPYLESAFLQRFAACLDKDDLCMIFQGPRGPEPLCGIYSKALIPLLRRLRETSRRSPRAVFEEVKVHYVTASEMDLGGSYAEKVLGNVNTPEEYGRLLKDEAQTG